MCRLCHRSARRRDTLYYLRDADRPHAADDARLLGTVAVRIRDELGRSAVAVRDGGELGDGRRAAAGGASATVAPPRSRVVTVIVAAVLVAVVAALLAVVALPRLLPVDPQKFVGDWAYTGNAADRVVITRVDNSFTIVFVGQDGRRESLPGVISDKKLVIDYDALGPQGKVVKKLAESVGAKLSFSYRKSDDRLLLSGSNASQGSFTIVMARTSAV